MNKLVKKAAKVVVSFAMIFTTMTINVSAATVDKPLDFTGSSTPTTGEGYNWDSATKTLVIKETGFAINPNPANYAITLPEDSTIVLNGDLDIRTENAGIYGEGDLSIIGSHDLKVSSDGRYSWNAIRSNDGAITINTTGDVDLYADYNECIHANGNIDITCNNLTVLSDGDNAIESLSGSLKLDVTQQSSIKTTAFNYSAICLNDMPLTISGGRNLIEGSYSLEIPMSSQRCGEVSIKDSAVVTIKNDNDVDHIPSVKGIKVESGSILNGILCNNNAYNVYGPNEITEDVTLYNKGFIFANGSKLIIKEGVCLDLKRTTFNAENATIINNGRLILPDDTDPRTLDFEGDGTVIVDSLGYKNRGNEVKVIREVNLKNKEVTTDDYTWLKNENSAYVLTLSKNIDISELVINDVDDVIIDLKEDTSISYFGAPKANSITITGGYKLTNQVMLNVGTEIKSTQLLIDKNTVLQSVAVLSDLKGSSDKPYDILVNGKLESGYIAASSLTINNGGELHLTDDDSGWNGLWFASYDGNKPEIKLGDEIKFVNASDYELIEEVDGDKSYFTYAPVSTKEAAKVLDFVAKDKYTITSEIIGSGTITPTDEDVVVLEGSNQVYNFTPVTGYVIKDVLVDGKSVGALTSYTFEDVTSDHTVKVVFEKLEDKPDTTKPDTSTPDTTKPDTSTPDTSKPDTSTPDTTKPDTSTPDTSKPDTSTPDTGDMTSVSVYGVMALISVLMVFAVNKKKQLKR